MVGFLMLAPLSGANGGGGGPVLDVTQLSLLSELSLRIFPSYNKHNISNIWISIEFLKENKNF